MPTKADGDPLMQAIMDEARRQGMSGLKLAEAADIAYSTLCDNAVGATSPRLNKIRIMLDTLGCDVQIVPKDSPSRRVTISWDATFPLSERPGALADLHKLLGLVAPDHAPDPPNGATI